MSAQFFGPTGPGKPSGRVFLDSHSMPRIVAHGFAECKYRGPAAIGYGEFGSRWKCIS